MLKANRLLAVAASGVLALCSLGIGAYFGSLYGPERKQYGAADSKGDDYNGPSESLRDISGIPALVERGIANSPPTTGQDHEKRDLAAQEATAMWAFWMAVIATFSAVVTTIGTVLLYQQINLTRRAVIDTSKATEAMHQANKIAMDAQRPWISVEVEVHQLVRTSSGFIAKGTAIFKNIGPSVARQFVPKVRGNFSNDGFTNSLQELFQKWKSRVEVTSEVLLPGEVREWPFDVRVRREDISLPGPNGTKAVFLVIGVAVFYDFNGGSGWSFRPFIVKPKANFDAYSISIPSDDDGTRSWKEFRIVPTAGSRTK